MTGEILGLSGPARRAEPPAENPRVAARGRRRGPSPPFRRRRAEKAAPPPGGPPPSPRDASRLVAGLSAGGTTEALALDARRRQVAMGLVSAAAHLLLVALMLSGVAQLPAPPARAVADAPAPEPLLYAFEAPPEVVPDPEPAPLTAPDANPLPEETPPAGAIVIPKAGISVPSTGFQNDLPFSEGDTEEFFTDTEAGEDPEGPEESDARTAPPVGEEDPFEEAWSDEAALAALEQLLGAESATEDPFERNGPPEALADALPPGGRLSGFDADAFRERIHDPTAEARTRAEELRRLEARLRVENERATRGMPTDIWRFLEGKRFRNPEGGLVSNRNNTLYYDDRGANLVPWIHRLIAEVRRNWYIPYSASYQAGHVAIAISVLRSGELAWLQVVVPSGVSGFDNAAVGALRGAQLLPLPDDYPGSDFEIMLVFWYNEQPYDLFGQSE